MTKFICFCAAILAGANSILGATLTVSGTQNPWLVTANPFNPDGNRPVLFTDFHPGDKLQFSATGNVAFSSGFDSDADGNEDFTVTYPAVTHISGITETPSNALLGVFLDDNDPASATDTPLALDFTSPAQRNYSTISPVLRQMFFIGDGKTSGGAAQNVVVPTGATRLFLGVLDHAGWADNTGAFNVSVSTNTPPQLTPITAFSYRTISPIRSSNPFEFTATESAVVSDLRLRVQYSRTPSIEPTWTDLPVGSQMFRVDNTWTVNAIDLPSGDIYFRAIADAPGFPDQISIVIGPITISSGIAPFGDFSYSTTSPARTGTPWTFTVVEPSDFVSLRVQSTTTPDVEASWTDLPGGGAMTRNGNIWSLNISNVPTGNGSFRVIASAAAFPDRISATLGPLQIQSELPVVKKTQSASGKYSLASLSEPADPPEMILAKAIGDANLHFALGDLVGGTEILNMAVLLYAEATASVDLTINAGESLANPGLNMGPNSSLILKGSINGDLGLLGTPDLSLITNDGGSLITNDGGSLSYDTASAGAIATASLSHRPDSAIISNDGASNVATAENGLITNDGGSIISNDGASFNARSRSGRNSFSALAASPVATGVMTVNGNYLQAKWSALTIAINGTNSLPASQEYDQLVVNGRADLGGVIAYGFFNSSSTLFSPKEGDAFDVVIATNIVAHNLLVRGPIWADGLHFRWDIVSLPNARQALRLTAVRIPPILAIGQIGQQAQVAFPTNYVGFTLEAASSLSASNWTPVSTGTNFVSLPAGSSASFFRLKKLQP